ncbi:hypothetical protein [Nostoc sp.]
MLLNIHSQEIYPLIEVRLPLAQSSPRYLQLNSSTRTTYKLAYNSGTIVVVEKDEGLKYYGNINLQRHITSGDREFTYNLLALALINQKILDLSKPQVFNNIEYPASLIVYQLEMDNDSWEGLIDQLENRELNERTLSIFFNLDSVNSSNYREVKQYKEKWLYITIHALGFILKPEISWLPEAGLPIELNISSGIDENFGVYGADKLYPVSEKRLEYWSRKDSSSSTYSSDTQEHRIGNQSVKRIMLALELLQGVSAWTTGENSIADVNFKWDLIVKVNNRCYPLQIKSNSETAVEAFEQYFELWEQAEIPFLPVIFWTNAGSCINKIAQCFANLFNVPLKATQASTNSEVALTKINSHKIYKHIDEVRTGNKAHKPIVEALFDAAGRGEWDKQAEDLLQAIVDRGKNSHYQLINHCSIIGKARIKQAEVLKEKLESLGFQLNGDMYL